MNPIPTLRRLLRPPVTGLDRLAPLLDLGRLQRLWRKKLEGKSEFANGLRLSLCHQVSFLTRTESGFGLFDRVF